MKNKGIIITIGIVLFVIACVVVFSLNNDENNGGGNDPVTYEPHVLTRMSETDIKEPKDGKLNVYLFWGDGCPHCKKLVAGLNKSINEYGKYYDLYTFEVWDNDRNYYLMQQVGEHFKEEEIGLPYLIIGDQTFSGYMSSYDEEIQKAIKEEYNETKKYNVFDELY